MIAVTNVQSTVLRMCLLAAAVSLLLAACGDSATDEPDEVTVTTTEADGGQSGARRTPPTTIPVDQLGAFALSELEEVGVTTTRIVEWVVVGDGRYVVFTQPAGDDRGARVRVFDRSRRKVRTVDADLGSVSVLLPAGGDGGVAYLAIAEGARSISYVPVDGEPVDLVSVPAGTTRIDNVAVDPTQSRVVWRELRQGRVQVLVSSDLDGGSVVLDETAVDGVIGEGVEEPIVLTDEGTVVYYADHEGDGDPTWYEVSIEGGEATEVER